MKILYFSRAYTPHDHRILAAIVEEGHEATYLRLQPEIVSETRRLPRGVNLASGRLENVIAQAKPDLIHAGPLTDCGYLAAKTGFHPLVQMSWGSDILWDANHDADARRRVRFAAKTADVMIGDCKAVRKAATKFGVKAQRIVTFPWGVDVKKFKPANDVGEIRKKLGWQNSFVLLHLRSWEPLYDPLTVVKAFVEAIRQNPRLRLLMPGSGIQAAKIGWIFAKAGVEDFVYLPGNVSYNELPDYFRSADLYVSASLSDGSSVSLMEALASGLPSVVSDIPGNREWVRPGKEGWLFPVRNYVRLSKLILKAANTMNLEKIRRQARETAESKANWSKNKIGLVRVYDLVRETRK